MNCKKARAMFNSSLDNEVSEVEKRTLDQHTAECAECRSYRMNLRKIDALLRATKPAGLEVLSQRVVQTLATTRVGGGRRVVFVMVEVAAAALFVVAVGLSIVMNRDVTIKEPADVVEERGGVHIDRTAEFTLEQSDGPVGRAFVVRGGALLPYDGPVAVRVMDTESGEFVLLVDAFPEEGA